MFSNLKHLFFDIHSHSKNPKELNWQLTNITLPKDNLEAIRNKEKFFSIGLHPWFLEKNYQEQMQKLIQVAQSENVWAVGETGLDKLAEVDFTLQTEVFRQHISISEQLQKPLIIHCVKAYSEISSLHKQLKPSQNWLIHGFRANIQTAKQLQQKGIYLSFGEALLKSPKLQETFAQIQSEYFFLETDDSQISIEKIYEKAAQIRKISLYELQNQIKQNLCKFFHKKFTFL